MMSERPTICEPEGIVHRPVGKMVNGQPAGWQCRGCDWTLEEVTGLASAIEDWWDWPEHRGVRFDVETEQGYRASLTGTGSNPYRTETAPAVDDSILVGFNGHVSRIGSRGIDYSQVADYAAGTEEW